MLLKMSMEGAVSAYFNQSPNDNMSHSYKLSPDQKKSFGARREGYTNTINIVPRGKNRYSFESVFYLHSHFWYKLYYPGPPPPLCLYVFMCNLIQFVTIHKPLFYDIVEIPISLLDDCHIILWNILKYYDFLLGSIII